MSSNDDCYTLYGAPVSLYTGKARSYLRTQGIDFVEEPPGSERYLQHIVPAVGRWIIPCLETPDGEIVQQSRRHPDHGAATRLGRHITPD